MLWSAWGRDWERRATPHSVLRTIRRDLRPGGTVLMHDTDRVTQSAADLLLRNRAVPFGTLADHW